MVGVDDCQGRARLSADQRGHPPLCNRGDSTIFAIRSATLLRETTVRLKDSWRLTGTRNTQATGADRAPAG
jgi:hypothetical protein